MGLQGKPLFAGVTTLTSLSFLLIGYDNGVLGGVIDQPAFTNTFPTLTALTLGLVVALYDVGCFLGAVACSYAGEKIGRRLSILTGGIIMFVGAILQASSYTFAQMVVARIISGTGMGFINSTAPVYQSEFSPAGARGQWACAMLSTLNLGLFLSYWITYGFAGQQDSYAWRVPVILQCIFIIPIIVLSLCLPESPRWLVAHDQHHKALSVLEASTYGRTVSAEETLHSINVAIATEKSMQVGILTALTSEDDIKSRRRLLIACGIQFFQQLGGINGIIYYAGTIFSTIGFDPHFAALMSGFLFTWFFVASFISWGLIDRIGRRPLFLVCISIMACVFAVFSAMVKQIEEQAAITQAAGIVAASMLFLYFGCFTVGFQATAWVYAPEVLPLKMRQAGTAIATAANWITAFIVVQVTPVGIQNLGWRYYIIYAVFNACFVPIIYLFFPETKGIELEDVDRLFASPEVRQIMDVDDPGKKISVKHVERLHDSER